MRFLFASVVLFSSLALFPTVAHAASVPCPSTAYTNCTSTESPDGSRVTETATLPVGATITVNGSKVTIPRGSTITRDFTKRYGQGTITYRGPNGEEINTNTQAIGLIPWGTPTTPTTPSTAGATPPSAPAPTTAALPGETRHDYCVRQSGGSDGKYWSCVGNELWEGVSSLGSWMSLKALWWVLSMTAYVYFLFAEFLMWLGTALFDNVLYFLVVHMAVFIQNDKAQGIRDAWIAIRDLMNIGIIAGFIIVGISTILQAQQYNANRFLARLIIAALLVNFSYFFAGAVIDASNFIATAAYQSKLMPRECVKLSDSKNLSYPINYTVMFFVKPTELCSVAATFTKTLNFGTWNQIRDYARSNSEGNTDSNKTVFFIGMIGGFFYVITGFVFFSAAVLLLGRFVVLILLLITSPVGVAGINIPYIDEYAKKWWGMLFSHSFFAPVFIILVAIGLRIIMDVKAVFVTNGSLASANYAAIASGNFQKASETIPMFVSFFVGIALMYAALQIARGMSESGKEFVGAIYEGLQKRVGSIYGDIYQATAGQAFRLPSAAYDATIGQAARIPIIGGILGRITTPVGKALRQDPGGRPFGASKSNADAAKETQEYIKSLETFGKPLEMLGTPGRAWDSFKKLTHLIGNPIDDLIESGRIGSIKSLLAIAAGGGKLTDAQRRKLERYAASLSDEDLGKMTSSELATIAPFMTVKQYKKTLERSDLNETQRAQIKDSRWKEFNTAVKNGDHDEAARLLRNMDKTERKLLLAEKDEVRTDHKILSALDAKTFDEVTGDKSLYGDNTELREIRDSRAGRIRTDLRSSNPKVRGAAIGRITDSDAERIKSGDVSDDAIAEMTPAQARKLHQGTKDPVLQRRLVARFPQIFGPTTSLEDEEKPEEKKEEEEEEEEEKPKPKPKAEDNK